MQFGFNAPTAGPMSATDQLVKLVVEGEAMGFDYATFSDHVVIPTDIEAKYPYSDTGEFPAGSRVERHEQLIEMAFVAAKTTKLRLVSSVMVVPHRPAVLTAKMLSTIDVLSGGRLVLGIGAGWMKEEFEAIQAPDFAERGKVTDEYIKAFIELWTKPKPELRGQVRPLRQHPDRPQAGAEAVSADLGRRRERPGAAPHRPARRRLVSDRHQPGQSARQPDALQGAGRAPAQDDRGGRPQARRRRCSPCVSPQFGENAPAKAGDGERRLFSGKPAELAADIKALARAWASAASTSASAAARVEAMLAEMQKFKRDVLALV